MTIKIINMITKTARLNTPTVRSGISAVFGTIEKHRFSGPKNPAGFLWIKNCRTKVRGIKPRQFLIKEKKGFVIQFAGIIVVLLLAGFALLHSSNQDNKITGLAVGPGFQIFAQGAAQEQAAAEERSSIFTFTQEGIEVTATDGTKFRFNDNGVIKSYESGNNNYVECTSCTFVTASDENNAQICRLEGTGFIQNCRDILSLNRMTTLQEAYTNTFLTHCRQYSDPDTGADNLPEECADFGLSGGAPDELSLLQARMFRNNIKNSMLSLYQGFIGNVFTEAAKDYCEIGAYYPDFGQEPKEVSLLPFIDFETDPLFFEGEAVAFPQGLREQLMKFDMLLSGTVEKVSDQYYRYTYVYRLIGNPPTYTLHLVNDCGGELNFDDTVKSEQLNAIAEGAGLSPTDEYGTSVFYCEEERCLYNSLCIFFRDEISYNEVSRGLVNRILKAQSGGNVNQAEILRYQRELGGGFDTLCVKLGVELSIADEFETCSEE